MQFLSLHSDSKFWITSFTYITEKTSASSKLLVWKIKMNGLMCTLRALFWQTEACNDKGKKQDWKASRCAMMLAQAGRNRKQPVTAKNFVQERPVTDVVRFQTLAILHKNYFDVTVQFLVYYNRIWRQISSTSRHRYVLTKRRKHLLSQWSLSSSY